MIFLVVHILNLFYNFLYNAACAFAVQSKSIEWMKIIDTLINEYGIDCHKNIHRQIGCTYNDYKCN